MVKPRAIPHLVSRMVERQDRDSWTPGQGTVSRPPTVPSVRPETPTDAPKMVTLADVDPTGLADGDVFAYEAASGMFKPAGLGVSRWAEAGFLNNKAFSAGQNADWDIWSDATNLVDVVGTNSERLEFNEAGFYFIRCYVVADAIFDAAGWMRYSFQWTAGGIEIAAAGVYLEAPDARTVPLVDTRTAVASVDAGAYMRLFWNWNPTSSNLNTTTSTVYGSSTYVDIWKLG